MVLVSALACTSQQAGNTFEGTTHDNVEVAKFKTKHVLSDKNFNNAFSTF